MPNLRSGVCRSKRVNNVQEDPAILVSSPQRGTGRGNSSKAADLKSPPCNLVSPVHPCTRLRPSGRGRGRRAMNQDKNAGVVGKVRTGFDGAAEGVAAIPNELAAEKLVAAEEEGNTTPLPERV